MAIDPTPELTWDEAGAGRRSARLSEAAVAVGRHPASDVVLSDPSVGRRHLRLVRVAGSYVLEDLGSRNGTFVDGVRAAGPVVLRDGAEVRAGDVTLTYRDGAGPPRPVTDGRRRGGDDTFVEHGPAPAVAAASARGRELRCWWSFFGGGGFAVGWEVRPAPCGPGDDGREATP